MAVYSMTDVSVVYNSVDLSSYVKKVELDINPNLLDTTGMGTTNNAFHTRIAGLKDWTVTLEFVQDFAASQVDATFGPDAIISAARTITIKPTSAAVSATNPRLFGSVLVDDYKPITGNVGDLAMAPVHLMGAGALTRATT